MKNKKYRIIKITYGDKREEFIVERKNWLGKWVNIFPEFGGFPETTFASLEAAEKAYAYYSVSPIAEVVKEY